MRGQKRSEVWAVRPTTLVLSPIASAKISWVNARGGRRGCSGRSSLALPVAAGCAVDVVAERHPIPAHRRQTTA